MPRVNVEDEIESDPRFHALARLVGDADKALGMLIRFWRLAQKFWGDETLVPPNLFKLGGFEQLLEVDLAVRFEEGIYCRGAEERFDWYLQKCRAARASVEARKQARLTADASRSNGTGRPFERNRSPVRTEPVARSNGGPAPFEPPSPVPSPSLSNSSALSTAPPVDKSPTQFAADHLALATMLHERVLALNPEMRRIPVEEAWANEFRIAEEQEQFTVSEAATIIDWALSDAFWKHRLQSPSGLRRNWAKLVEEHARHAAMLANH